MPIKLKQQYAGLCIGYNNSSAPLGSRNDLDLLYQRGASRNLPHITTLFEEVPDTLELEEMQVSRFEEKQTAKKVRNGNAANNQSAGAKADAG